MPFPPLLASLPVLSITDLGCSKIIFCLYLPGKIESYIRNQVTELFMGFLIKKSSRDSLFKLRSWIRLASRQRMKFSPVLGPKFQLTARDCTDCCSKTTRSYIKFLLLPWKVFCRLNAMLRRTAFAFISILLKVYNNILCLGMLLQKEKKKYNWCWSWCYIYFLSRTNNKLGRN